MGLGVGLVLTAEGAILALAVNTTVSGVNIHTIGRIRRTGPPRSRQV